MLRARFCHPSLPEGDVLPRQCDGTIRSPWEHSPTNQARHPLARCISSFLNWSISKGQLLSCCQLNTSPARASEGLEAEPLFLQLRLMASGINSDWREVHHQWGNTGRGKAPWLINTENRKFTSLLHPVKNILISDQSSYAYLQT